MFTIVPVIVVIGFIIVFGTILVRGVQGAAQWKKNNDSPVLTVEAEVVAKRLDVQTWRHAGDEHHMGHTSSRAYYYATFQVESGDRMEFQVPDTEYGLLVEGGPGKADLPGHPLPGVPAAVSAAYNFKGARPFLKAVYRWTFYILGMLVLALGLTLNTKAGLGVSPIISIAFAVSEIWGWNFGDMTFLLYSLFVAETVCAPGGKTAGSPTCSSCP